MSFNQYVADELANKVLHLSKALDNAQNTILFLKNENKILEDVLAHLTSINNEDDENYIDNYCVEPTGNI